MTPPDPAGSAASIFSPMPLWRRCFANLPITPPAAAPTAPAASSGGASSPTARPAPAPSFAPLRPRWSPDSITCTSPSASFWTTTTPSTVTVLSSASFNTASKSRLARSSKMEAAITTSLWSLLMVAAFLCRDAADGVALRGVLVEVVLVLAVQVRRDVEDDLLDGASEFERGLLGVVAVDDEAVVLADVEAAVAAEAERNRVVEPAAADG